MWKMYDRYTCIELEQTGVYSVYTHVHVCFFAACADALGPL